MMKKIFASVATLALLAGCSSKSAEMTTKTSAPQPTEIKAPMKEFRAAWVATVANIDWPTQSTLTTEEQKAEAIAILDKAQELNLNAIIWQGRPAADALYDSNYEPWSFYLTNEMGTAPDPYYDPLEFWVEEAHKRGIELHVWFNPYRALHPNQINRGGKVSEDSIVTTRPDLALELEQGYRWLDPTNPEVQDLSINVVMDVVNRYDVDGIHFDDYFYPYPSYNGGKDFPDDAGWAAYQASGGELSRGDWRRKGVDDFVQRLYGEIKASKPTVKFGISPFGIYRPGYPESIQGFDQYDQLYADARLWLQEGWVDYFTPQLYWPIGQIPQSYPVLLNWWDEANTMNRNLWPGTSIGRASTEEGTTEIKNQIMINRGLLKDESGIVFFSMKTLQREDYPLADTLGSSVFKQQALVPPSPWLDDEAPAIPFAKATKGENSVVVNIEPRGDEEPFLYVVYKESGGRWSYEIIPAVETSLTLASGGTRIETTTSNQGLDVTEEEVKVPEISRIAVSAVDRTGNESDRLVLSIK